MLDNEKGFTLIEILMVVGIIGILFVSLSPNMDSVTNNTRISVVDTEFSSLQSGIHQHFIDSRNQPFTEVEVEEYIDVKFQKYSLDSETVLKFRTEYKVDPWNKPYHLYISNQGQKYVMLHSYGPDGIDSINGSQVGDDIIWVYYPK